MALVSNALKDNGQSIMGKIVEILNVAIWKFYLRMVWHVKSVRYLPDLEMVVLYADQMIVLQRKNWLAMELVYNAENTQEDLLQNSQQNVTQMNVEIDKLI